MLIALSKKNKLGFVDGIINKPEGNDFDLFNSWIRNNNIVISWILNSASNEIFASVMFATNAHEIQTNLKDRFQQKNRPCIFQMRRELMNFAQDHNSI